ncbi:MAG: arginine--tRNA ligase [Patescibacteria group bacterium]
MFNDIREVLREEIVKAVAVLNLNMPADEILIEHPADLKFGDYSTNVAMALAQKTGQNPRDLAAKIAAQIAGQKNENIEKVEAAGAGFINFYLTAGFYTAGLKKILVEKDNFGQNTLFEDKKVMVEYTDPNPFKLFHIGHLMTNTIGESLARLFQVSGADARRACYQGDVGIHVAKAIWGMSALKDERPAADSKLAVKVTFLGQAYAFGTTKAKEDPTAAAEIKILNKKIYERSDGEINKLYDLGKKWSLEYFDTVYQRLGTAFDYKFFESETGKAGRETVDRGLQSGVFEKSDGAVVFKGEPYGLHTRVFLNSDGLPTYEAKELGLAKIKYGLYPYDLSVVVTGNEINDYFKVLLQVMNLLFPDLAAKTKHLGHGFLRLPGGKMSSRTGTVITAEEVIDKAKAIILTKMKETKKDIANLDETADQIAIGAIKYSILKQDIGKDIIFDFDKSLSFVGHSGPYLQYTYARTQSVLEKAASAGITFQCQGLTLTLGDTITPVEKMLYRFPEVVERAVVEYAPHYIATYLYELAGVFNNYYADHKIVSAESHSSYRVALTTAVGQVLKNGLNLLGIKTPAKM